MMPNEIRVLIIARKPIETYAYSILDVLQKHNAIRFNFKFEYSEKAERLISFLENNGLFWVEERNKRKIKDKETKKEIDIWDVLIVKIPAGRK